MNDCHCSEGWVCEAHPDLPWPHDDGDGPGMLYTNPGCQAGRDPAALLDLAAGWKAQFQEKGWSGVAAGDDRIGS
jgi:hypothetical protein